jgi:serine/threonine-protein kinase RsbT
MNNEIIWTELARLPIAKMQDVLVARFVGRDEAAKMGFPPVLLTRLATAISEMTRNVVQHAGCPGEFQIGRLAGKERTGLRILIADQGRGIETPERFLGEMTQSALGSGLAGTQRIMDTFQIESGPGVGTTVTMELWKPAATDLPVAVGDSKWSTPTPPP